MSETSCKNPNLPPPPILHRDETLHDMVFSRRNIVGLYRSWLLLASRRQSGRYTYKLTETQNLARVRERRRGERGRARGLCSQDFGGWSRCALHATVVVIQLPTRREINIKYFVDIQLTNLLIMLSYLK